MSFDAYVYNICWTTKQYILDFLVLSHSITKFETGLNVAEITINLVYYTNLKIELYYEEFEDPV